MLFQLFKKKKTGSSVTDLSFLRTDMHSHLVPGVDDGSDSVGTSLALLEGFVCLGYKKVITTPHVRPDYFPNTSEILTAGFKKLKSAVEASGLDIEVEFAAEYFVDFDFLKKIESEDLLTFSGNHVLIEISTFSPPPNLFDTVFQLRIKGYQPILAHPERYVYYANLEAFEKLKDFGCLFQTNILSLAGHYGKEVKELSNRLLKNGMIDLLATDMHHVRHLESLKQLASTNEKVMKLIHGNQFMNSSF